MDRLGSGVTFIPIRPPSLCFEQCLFLGTLEEGLTVALSRTPRVSGEIGAVITRGVAHGKGRGSEEESSGEVGGVNRGGRRGDWSHYRVTATLE